MKHHVHLISPGCPVTPGVKARSVSDDEPWPGQPFRSQQATLTNSQGSQDQIPYSQDLSQGQRQKGQSRRQRASTAQPAAGWAPAGREGPCQPSPLCAQFSLIGVASTHLHLLALLISQPHLRGCSYYPQLTDKIAERFAQGASEPRPIGLSPSEYP